jgi:hypothetical protein
MVVRHRLLPIYHSLSIYAIHAYLCRLKVESPSSECCTASHYEEHDNVYPGKMRLFDYCLGLDMWNGVLSEEGCLLTFSDREVDKNGLPSQTTQLKNDLKMNL